MSSVLIKIKTFFYSAISGLKISLGGQLGFNEILAISDSLSIKSWKKLYRDVPAIKNINLAYLVFLVSQMISDMVNRSAPQDFIRGWANIVMAVIVTNFLAKMFWRRNDAIIFYLFGMIVSAILFGPEREGVGVQDMGFIKFKLVPILNSAIMIVSILILSKTPKARHIVVVLITMYALFCIASDARSNGMIFLLVALLFYKKEMFDRLSFKRILPYLAGIAILGQIAYSYYVSEVLAGNLGGKHAQEQFERTENPYNPVHLLLSGRTEVYVGMMAALDKPLFGHGSWAPDPGGKYNLVAFKMHGEEERLEILMATGKDFYIPSHSVIMGTWMSAGVGALLAIVYIIVLLYKCLGRLLRSRLVRDSPYFPIVVWYTISPLWTFMFSPLPHIKQTLPVLLAFIVVLARKVELRQLKAYYKRGQLKEWNESAVRNEELATT